MYINDVFRYMKHIFFMYRCNSLIGFGGEMNDMLSVSVRTVVSSGGNGFMDKLSKQSTPDEPPLTYQDKHMLQYTLYNRYVY